MNKKIKIALVVILFLGLVVATTLFLQTQSIPVLETKGLIAHKQRDLIITATLLMLIVVIPVFILTFISAWKYRASNTKAKYEPEWDFNAVAETTWWGLPILIIAVLSVITWKSSHELDPYQPLKSEVKPVTIQVIALNWKWLFIYPEQKIATRNFIQFPVNTPINFEITADAPMNSFWIPQLGGQIYAMPGMKTKLHLIADEAGNYRGSSANLSGQGFASMTFMAKACSELEFHEWVEKVQKSGEALTTSDYTMIALPSENDPVSFYVLKDSRLFDRAMMKYMLPMKNE